MGKHADALIGMVEEDAIDKDVGDVGDSIDFIRCDVDDVIAGQAAEIADGQELSRPEEMQSVLIAGGEQFGHVDDAVFNDGVLEITKGESVSPLIPQDDISHQKIFHAIEFHQVDVMVIPEARIKIVVIARFGHGIFAGGQVVFLMCAVMVVGPAEQTDVLGRTVVLQIPFGIGQNGTVGMVLQVEAAVRAEAFDGRIGMELQAMDESGPVHDETDAAFRFRFVEKGLQGSRVIGSPAGKNVAVENRVLACIIGAHDGPRMENLPAGCCFMVCFKDLYRLSLGDFPPNILLVSSLGDFDGIDEQFTNGVSGAKHQTIAARGEHVEIQ